jgi:hypothetical protein
MRDVQTIENTAEARRQQTLFKCRNYLKIQRRLLSPGKRRNTHLAEIVETAEKAEAVEAMEYP